MDESEFHRRADQTLAHLVAVIDETLDDLLEADLLGGILTITLPDGGQYIVNKNAHLAQIWLSSPRSGAWHFEAAGEGWRSTRSDKSDLFALLAGELAVVAGRPVSF